LLHNEGNSFSPGYRFWAVLVAIALKAFRIIRWQRELVFVPLRNDKRSSFLTKILSSPYKNLSIVFSTAHAAAK